MLDKYKNSLGNLSELSPIGNRIHGLSPLDLTDPLNVTESRSWDGEARVRFSKWKNKRSRPFRRLRKAAGEAGTQVDLFGLQGVTDKEEA